MLDVLTEGFREAKLKFKGKTTLKEENVTEAIAAIRSSLLEADVEYGVTKEFLNRVKEEVLGTEIRLTAGTGANRVRVSPGDHFVGVCQKQLENLMGPVDTSLDFPANRPGIVMMVGLQGSGKTTTTGKVARFLMNSKRRPILVAADIYRPAAVEQLRILGERLGIPVFHKEGASPVDICKEARQKAFDLDCDTILFDTAGRLTVDDELMAELENINAATKPDHILLVCDAMMGQDAVTTARAFHERLNLSGIVMTKLDGDARGGAALSIKEVTGAPIKFLGMGEELDKLEEFRPEGLASRILGMGDVVGLMDDFQKVVDEDHEKDAMKMLSGQFSYVDFYKQIQMIQKMGSMKDLVAKMPMQDMLPKDADLDDKQLTRIKAIIDSMTLRERKGIDPLNPSRIKRISRGSGRPDKEVQDLVKKFSGMRKMMGMMGKNMGGMLSKIPGMGGLGQLNNMRKMAKQMGGAGGMPGGMPGMGDMAAMLGGGGGGGERRQVDRDKQRKMRKAAKKARKRNRRK